MLSGDHATVRALCVICAPNLGSKTHFLGDDVQIP